jgi:hypothetical protein
MSFSSLYKFALKLKGKGHFLSPKEVKFLKELLNQFSEEEIRAKLEKCYKELLPPAERFGAPLTKCRKLFQNQAKDVYLNKEENLPSLADLIKQLPYSVRPEIYRELKKLKVERGRHLKDSKTLEDFIRLLIRKYT